MIALAAVGCKSLLAGSVFRLLGERLHDQGNTLISESVHVTRCGVVDRSALYHAECYNTRMNQPCEQALAEQPLESVVCASVAAVGATKEFEFEDKAVFPVAYDEIEAVETVETDCRPFLALVPTIRTTVEFRLLDETSTFGAIWLARFGLLPRMCVNARSRILIQDVAHERENEAPLKVTLVCKVALEVRSAQSLDQDCLELLQRAHRISTAANVSVCHEGTENQWVQVPPEHVSVQLGSYPGGKDGQPF